MNCVRIEFRLSRLGYGLSCHYSQPDSITLVHHWQLVTSYIVFTSLLGAALLNFVFFVYLLFKASGPQLEAQRMTPSLSMTVDQRREIEQSYLLLKEH